MKAIIKDKHGGFTDLFLFMIFTFIIIVACGILIFSFATIETHLHDTLGQMDNIGDTNVSQVIDNSVGATNISFKTLYWLSVLIIFGMILGVFIGSYMVTTKPIFFVPYLFIWIIAILVSVPISNAYETLSETPELASTYAQFVGSNFILNNLPMMIAIIGIVGAIIMFTRMGRKEEYGGYYS